MKKISDASLQDIQNGIDDAQSSEDISNKASGFAEKLSHAIHSPSLKALGNAEESNRMLKSGGIAALIEKINLTDGILRKAKRAVVRSIESSSILRYLRRAVAIILYKPLRTYGLLLTFIALFGGGLFSLGYFEVIPIGYSIDSLTVYAVMLCCGLPMMLFGRRSLVDTVDRSVILGRFLKRNLAMDEQKLFKSGVLPTGGFNCLLVSVIFTVVTLFVPITDILLFFFLTGLFVFLIYNPECGLMSSLILLPLVGENIITKLLLVTALSYMIKLIRVKRSFSLELADIFVLLLFVYRLLLTASGGGKGLGFSYIIILFTYFVAKNLVLTKRQISICFSCITAGAVAGSLFRLAKLGCEYFNVFPEIHGMLSYDALWSGDDFCGFCAMVLPICMAWVLNRYSRGHIFGYIVICASPVAAVILTGSGNEWIAMASALVIYLLLCYRKRFAVLIFGCALIPAVCYAAVYFGTLLPVNGSIYSGMTFRYGLMGTAVFMLVFLVLLQLMFSAKAVARKYENADRETRNGRYHGLVAASGAVMISVLIYGAFAALDEYACSLLFWISAAMIGSASNMFAGRGVDDDLQDR